MAMRWANIRNIIFFIGILAVALMIYLFDMSLAEIWQLVLHMGYCIPIILVLWVFLYFLNTLSWYIILRESGPVPMSLLMLLKITISGFALNSATPVGLLGGEPYKIMELTPVVGAQRATSSVVLFSMMHVFSHFFFWLTGIVLYILLLPIDGFAAIALSIMAVFCAVGIYFFVKGYRNGLILRLLTFLSRIPGLKTRMTRFIEKHSDSLHTTNQQVAALMSQSKKAFYASLFLEYIGRMLQSVEVMVIILFVHSATSWPLLYLQSVIILAFTSLFANMLFFIPMQMGGREGGFAMSTARIGLSGQVGISISIITRIRELFLTALGIAMMKINVTKSKK